MWVWRQTTGTLYRDGRLIGSGYSGAAGGRNSPRFENVQNVGPLPQGWYSVGKPFDSEAHGPFVLPLTPAPETEMFGRSGFLIHGDAIDHLGQASHGCIILGRSVRELIAFSKDNQLTVVP